MTRSNGIFTTGLALALALALGIAGTALAWNGGRGRGERGDGYRCFGPRPHGVEAHRGWHDEGFRRGWGDAPCALGPLGLEVPGDLGLTREQSDRAEDLWTKHRRERREAWDRLQDLRDDLRRESLAAKPDEAKVRELSRKLGEAVGEATLLASRFAGEFKAMLTPEQRERLEELENRGTGRHRGMRGWR